MLTAFQLKHGCCVVLANASHMLSGKQIVALRDSIFTGVVALNSATDPRLVRAVVRAATEVFSICGHMREFETP